ncbi:UNKNOWN [Stylonychia lemnae]|uniref:Uncharacterized protein n=1 Tax=Stylonychia lemnae TaxID=5949 RepID=A0A078BA00_STYLE|nr:UNKNOWN [Stylonychia lemnae]|eukprot:CDW90092.1 UNKNOWN [Stylonychia lemnae]
MTNTNQEFLKAQLQLHQLQMQNSIAQAEVNNGSGMKQQQIQQQIQMNANSYSNNNNQMNDSYDKGSNSNAYDNPMMNNSMKKRFSAGRERNNGALSSDRTNMSIIQQQNPQLAKIGNQYDVSQNKPPRMPSKGPMGGKLMAPIDHEKQRQKLQEIMGNMMSSDDEESKLYESLNPTKKSLDPLQNQGQRKRSVNDKQKKYSQNTNKLDAIQRQDSAKGVRIRTNNKPNMPNKDVLAAISDKQFSIKNNKKANIRKELNSSQSDRDKQRRENSQNKNDENTLLENVDDTIKYQSQGKKGKKYGSKIQNGKISQSTIEGSSSNMSQSQYKSSTQYTSSEIINDSQSEKLLQDSKQDGKLNQNETMNDSADALALNFEQKKVEIEKYLEVRDRFYLMSYGLQLKESLRKRAYFLEAVDEIKRRLRKVLYMWQDKKAEENFKALTSLIENYDKDAILTPSYTTPKPKNSIGGKLSKKRNIRVKKTPVLQTVEEKEEELEETTLKDLDESRLNSHRFRLDSENLKINHDYGEDYDQENYNNFQEEEKAIKVEEEQKYKKNSPKKQQKQEQKQEGEGEFRRLKLKQAIRLRNQMEEEEISDEITEQMIEKILIQQLLQINEDIQKVESTIHMWVHRRRYLNFRKRSIKIQAFIRMKQQQQKYRKLMEEKILSDLNNLPPQQLINFAPQIESGGSQFNSSFASSIQNSGQQKIKLSKQSAVFIIERCWMRYREKEEGKKIREYLRGIPYECRRSYVKYWDLKFKTYRLKTEVAVFTRRF